MQHQADLDPQAEVVRVYNEKVAELRQLQDNWDYMTSKHLTDFRLFAEADLHGSKVLNVGCSFPIDEILYAHQVSSWTATDLGENTIRVAEEEARNQLHPELFARLAFRVADGTALPFEDDEFDVAVSLSTVDHVPSADGRQRFINEMARVTRPGGRVVVTVPNRWSRGYARRAELLPASLAPDYFEYCFSPVELRNMVRAAGLRIVRFTSTSEMPVLAPRAVFPRLRIRPVMGIYTRLARYFGTRMGILAMKE
jgi:SAM-dependent methyltransferase